MIAFTPVYEEVVCRETDGISACYKLIDVKLVELDGGLVGLAIDYQGRTMYIPPILGNDTIVPLPKKYEKPLRDVGITAAFPELVFVPRGRLG